MATLTTKTELIDLIQSERQRLLAAIEGLSDAELTRPGQNGELSVKDTLAHSTAWEQECLGWYRAGLRGEMPERPNPDNQGEVDRWNRALFEKYRNRPLAEVRAAFEQSYRDLMASIERMTEGELFTPGRYEWTDDEPLVAYLRANSDEHYTEHTAEILHWRQAEGL